MSRFYLTLAIFFLNLAYYVARVFGVVMAHPDWALKFKEKGTELRCIRNKYYLYQATSVWDKEKKRAVKKTGKCIGSISEHGGLKPSRNNTTARIDDFDFNPKVFGAPMFFKKLSKDWEMQLKRYFPDYWKQILCMVYARLFKRSPIKNMNFFYETSILTEFFPDLTFSDKTISNILKSIGLNQSRTEMFMKEFIGDNSLVLIDATAIFSKSKNIHEARLGYNNKKQWDPQVNLLYLYSQQTQAPLFYKLSPGDVREVKNLELTLMSAGITNAIVVGDKGFTSKLNIEIMESHELNYILPLKRNDKLIDYTVIKQGKKEINSFFKFKDRYIWYTSKEIGQNKRLITFLDESLKVAEEHDYLDRIEKNQENYCIENFHEKNGSMGTISTVDNVPNKTPMEIFTTYKSRGEIEQLFDVFKNELLADKTYMHSIESLQGWLFINHLAIVAYYKIYLMLQNSGLIEKISVHDILEHLYHISIVKINEVWKVQRISTKTENTLKKINFNIPITWVRES